MRLHSLQLIFLFLFLKIAQQILVIPFTTFKENQEINNFQNFIQYSQPNKIYSEFEIGKPSQKMEVVINDDNYGFFVSNLICYTNSFYNIYDSNTFKNITPFNIKKYPYSNCAISEDIINLYTDLELKNKIEINNFNFLYTNTNNNINCGTIGLGFFEYTPDENCENFIIEMKKLQFIDDYSWTIKYTKNESSEYDGLLVIGGYPHEYENKIFDLQNFRTTLVNLNEKGWNMEFQFLYSGEEKLTHYLDSVISFDTSFFVGTEEYKTKISTQFFKEFINKNICFEDNYNYKNIGYYCKKSLFTKENITNFPTLKFYQMGFNYTFEFTGNDLFIEINDNYYFGVIFDRYDYRSWNLGKIFLEKYQLVFNHNNKIIGFYIEKEKYDGEGKKGDEIFNRRLLIIIIIILAIIFFGSGFYIGYKIYYRKKGKSTELQNDEENYDYNIYKEKEKEKGNGKSINDITDESSRASDVSIG